MVGIMKTLEFLPCQLMPLIWKTVVTIEDVCKKHDLTITLEDLKSVYQVKLAKKGIYTFKANSVAQILIQNVPKDGDSWKSQYFFIQTTGWDSGMDFVKFDLNT